MPRAVTAIKKKIAEEKEIQWEIKLGRGKIKAREIIDIANLQQNTKLKRMVEKQKKTMWTWVMTIKWVLGRQLVSGLILDRKVIKETWMLFTNETSAYKVLNADVAQDLNFKEYRSEPIELRWAPWQFIQRHIDFKYPYIDTGEKWVEVITRFFKDNIIINYLVAKSLIDDETFQIIKEFLATFDVFYNPDKLSIGFAPRMAYKGNSNSVSLEELLKAEIEQWYVNEVVWDKQRKFSYTHILRRNLDLQLQKWQKTLITSWKQYNFVAWSRRIGKSFLSAYIAYREFYRKGSGYGDRNRQVLYVTLNDKKAWQPFQYMMQMTETDRKLWYITVNTANKEFTSTITWTKLIFITSWQHGWAASYWADLVVVDEAAMIRNEFWDDLLPIIVQERATVFAISTINEEAKQNWFYKYLLAWEMWDENIQSIRVTIDDNELLREEDKEAMKLALVDNQLKYWTQLYSIFPTWSTIFNLNWAIQSIDTTTKRDLVLIGYDPAKLWDNASFVIVDPNTFHVIDEHILKWISYMEQKEYLIQLKKQHHMSIVIMDRTWVWEWVYEIFWDLIDVSVKYKAVWEVKMSPLWYWMVSKWELVDTLKLYIDHYWLKVSDTLENLIKEFKSFKALTDRGRVIQYWWVWFTDDSINALWLITFYLKHISWITWALDFKSKTTTIEIDQYWNVIDSSYNQLWMYTQEYNYEDLYKNFTY